jgi:hypothetical protein
VESEGWDSIKFPQTIHHIDRSGEAPFPIRHLDRSGEAAEWRDLLFRRDETNTRRERPKEANPTKRAAVPAGVH